MIDPTDTMAGGDRSPWKDRGAASSAWWAPLWMLGIASGIVGASLATFVIGSGDATTNELVVSAGVVLVALAVVGVALRVHHRFQSQPGALVPACMAWWILLGVEGATLGRNVGVAPMIVTVAVCTVLLVTLLGIRSPATQSWSPHLGCAAVGAGVAAAALVVIDGDLGGSAFVLALIAAGAAAIAVTEPPWRLGAEFVGIASGLGSLSFLLLALEADATAAAFAFVGAGSVLAATAAARSTRRGRGGGRVRHRVDRLDDGRDRDRVQRVRRPRQSGQRCGHLGRDHRARDRPRRGRTRRLAVRDPARPWIGRRGRVAVVILAVGRR